MTARHLPSPVEFYPDTTARPVDPHGQGRLEGIDPEEPEATPEPVEEPSTEETPVVTPEPKSESEKDNETPDPAPPPAVGKS